MGLKQKSKKNMQTMSMGRRRKESATSKVAASTVKKEDEWIGSLQ